jgi:hypothetical protein
MKLLILASIFCLTFAITLSAQAPIKVVPQIIPLPANIGVWSVVQGIQNSHKHELLVPRELKGRVPNLMKFDASQSGVCSVPLLEANANANDPGIAVTPRDNSVPIPQARVPAPPCKKQ